MAKNRQKSAKFIRKIDFLYNNFPKKASSLRKCTKKYISPSAKKKSFFFSRLRRETVLSTPPGGGCYRNFATMPRLQRPYTWAKMPKIGKKRHFFSAQKWSKNGPKVVKNGQNCPKIGEINCGGPPENPNESQKYRKNGQKRSH